MLHFNERFSLTYILSLRTCTVCDLSIDEMGYSLHLKDGQSVDIEMFVLSNNSTA